MDLYTYISDTSRRAALASALGTTPAYIWQIATGWRGRRVPPHRCIAIEEATAGEVTRYELRPDVFGAAPATEKVA